MHKRGVENMSTIDKIIDILATKGLTQKELTDYLDIDKSTFSQWKNGKSQSYNKYISKIAEFLGVSTDELIGSGEAAEPVYLDNETRELLDTLRKRPEMRTLFKVSQNASKEDVEMAVDIIEKFKKGSGTID
jgi:transcriptional regulator with XRE-family HTH domain